MACLRLFESWAEFENSKMLYMGGICFSGSSVFDNIRNGFFLEDADFLMSHKDVSSIQVGGDDLDIQNLNGVITENITLRSGTSEALCVINGVRILLAK